LMDDWPNVSNFSCLYAQNLGEKYRIFHRSRPQDALEDVQEGRAYGWLKIPPNFSHNLLASQVNLEDSLPSVQESIQLWSDHSNYVVSGDLQRGILTELERSVGQMLASCNISFPGLMGIQFASIGGEHVMSYGISILPCLMVVIQHLFASSLTADQLVTERESGLLQRQLANGIRVECSLLIQVLVHFLVIIPQVT
jgi:hypothetical protein